MPSTARIMVAEPIYYSVPNGREFLYEKGFAQRNPNVFHHQIAAEKIFKSQVLCISYGLGVLAKARIQHLANGSIQAKAPLAGSFWNCLADINWPFKSAVLIFLSICL